MVVTTVTVVYSYKDMRGYLVEASRVFFTHKDAVDFIASLNKNRLVGKVLLDIGSAR